MGLQNNPQIPRVQGQLAVSFLPWFLHLTERVITRAERAKIHLADLYSPFTPRHFAGVGWGGLRLGRWGGARGTGLYCS